MPAIFGLVSLSNPPASTSAKIAGLVAAAVTSQPVDCKPVMAIAVPARSDAAIYSLRRGRSQRTHVGVLPDGSLYRIEWPDIGVSQPANLTRCKAAAREWAERKAVLVDDRKNNAARRLKSLDNFWWSSSLAAKSNSGRPATPPHRQGPACAPAPSTQTKPLRVELVTTADLPSGAPLVINADRQLGEVTKQHDAGAGVYRPLARKVSLLTWNSAKDCRASIGRLDKRSNRSTSCPRR